MLSPWSDDWGMQPRGGAWGSMMTPFNNVGGHMMVNTPGRRAMTNEMDKFAPILSCDIGTPSFFLSCHHSHLLIDDRTCTVLTDPSY
jgi:hypothetical protein